MKKLIIAIVIFSISLCFAGISTTTNIMPAQVCTTDTFTFTFPINSTSDLKVITIRTSDYDVNTLTISTDYTVSATNNDYSSGGTVTTASTFGSGYKLIVYRDTELTQSTTLISDSGVLRTRQLVSALDKQMMILQDVQEQTDRSLKFPIDINSVSAEIPSQTERAGKYLAFNSSGLPVATSVITTGTTSFSTFGEDVVSAANAAALQALINYPILRDGTITYTDNQPMGGFKITGYGTPSDENDVTDVNYVKDSTITLKNKTLASPTLTTPTITSPVINTGVSGTAIDTDGTLAANSDTKLASQKATKTYVDTTVTGVGFLKTNTTASTPIYDSNCGTAWRTLDVSALGSPAVGANSALLFLEIEGGAATHFMVKPYGYGSATPARHYSTSYPTGSAECYFGGSAEFRYLTVMTDTAGKLQISESAGAATITIKLIGYIK